MVRWVTDDIFTYVSDITRDLAESAKMGKKFSNK